VFAQDELLGHQFVNRGTLRLRPRTLNQAYAANDLLTLLELQLQIEQIDAGHIAAANAQRLKHYNQVLKEQLDELRAEIEHVEMGFRLENGLAPG
jgi:hypothetical protein